SCSVAFSSTIRPGTANPACLGRRKDRRAALTGVFGRRLGRGCGRVAQQRVLFSVRDGRLVEETVAEAGLGLRFHELEGREEGEESEGGRRVAQSSSSSRCVFIGKPL